MIFLNTFTIGRRHNQIIQDSSSSQILVFTKDLLERSFLPNKVTSPVTFIVAILVFIKELVLHKAELS